MLIELIPIGFSLNLSYRISLMVRLSKNDRFFPGYPKVINAVSLFMAILPNREEMAKD